MQEFNFKCSDDMRKIIFGKLQRIISARCKMKLK